MKKREKLTKLGEDVYNSLYKKSGYVKGYGNQLRVMDAEHRPCFNVPKEDCAFLIAKGILTLDDRNVYILSERHNSLYNQIQVDEKDKSCKTVFAD